MTLEQFIREYREEIDLLIAEFLGKRNNPYPNDEERRLWVLNNEAMYHWARRCGVNI